VTLNARLWRVVKNLGRDVREVRLSEDDWAACMLEHGPTPMGMRLEFAGPGGVVELLPPEPEPIRWPHDADGRPVEGA
jgi:hypothetical protein